jgi:hypothetical protein
MHRRFPYAVKPLSFRLPEVQEWKKKTGSAVHGKR